MTIHTETCTYAPLERRPEPLTKAQTNALAQARATAERVVEMTMDEATADSASLLGRLRRGALLHQGFYPVTLAGVRTLYVRA